MKTILQKHVTLVNLSTNELLDKRSGHCSRVLPVVMQR